MKSNKSNYYIAGSVSVITLLVYLSSIQNKFVEWDDPDYVSENLNLRSLDWTFIKWAFSAFYASNWHPLTWISHALDYALWGLNPLGHHLTNNILHAVNTFVVVLLVMKLMEAVSAVIPVGATPRGDPLRTCPESILKKDSRRPSVAGMTNQFNLSMDTKAVLIAAATTGLLFGLHPLHVESVAWVSERKDLLCALFFLLSIMMYMSYMSHKTYRTYFISLAFYTLALLSKPMAVSLPVVLLILDWYPLKKIQSVKTFRSAFIEKLPFFALSLISSILSFLAQKEGGAVVSITALPISTRLLLAGKSLIAYLWKMVLPINLIPFYQPPKPNDVSFSSAEYFFPGILVIGITVICLGVAKKQKLWLSAWCYYIITLIPVLGIIQVGGQLMADRYTYLPGLAPFLVMGLAVAWVREKVHAAKKWYLVFKLFCVALFVCITFSTITQIGIWKSDIDLWSSAIEKGPSTDTFSRMKRGLAYKESGQFDKALEDFNKAIELDKNYKGAYMNRGNVYLKTGNKELAVSDFQRACDLGDQKACNALKLY